MHAKPALLVVLCTLFSASIASATTDFRVLADLDNNPSSGCTVNGMPGVERVLTTTIDTSGATPRVIAVTQQDCSGTSLSGLITLSSAGWPASTNLSTGVSIIETQIPLSAFGSPLPHVMRLGFVMTSGSQTAAILTDANGNPFLFPGNGGKHRIVGTAARSFTADGNPADWAGIAALANGDSNEANTFRIINVFGFLTKDSAFFRFDAQSHASAPTARNDTYSTPQSTPLSVSGPGVLGNDTDPNNKPLSAIQVSSPDRGALVLNGDGSFTYTPDGAAPGHEVFTYQATNGAQPSNVARVEIRVGQTNHPPNAGDDNYNVLAGGTINAPAPGVLANDTDPDGDALHTVLRTSPAHGTLTLNADGSFIYVNDGSSLLDDSFTYVASDGVDVSREATVHLHVGTNDAPPVAVSDDYTVAEGGTLTVAAPGVLANDHDADTPANQLLAVLSAGPQHGTVALNSNGSFTYVHNGSETTSDFFTYRVYDHQLFSNVATVHITITPVNDAPTAVNDSYTTLSGITLNVAAPGVLSNDTDPDSPASSLTSSVFTTAANGALTLNANGSFTYIPNPGFFGTDSFTYRTSDGLLQSLPATVTIIVDKIPVITSANNVTFTIGVLNTFNVTTSAQPAASIAENGALPAGVTFVDGTGPNKGTGVLSGTPGPGTAGVYNITFTATNSHGSSAPQSFTLTVVCPAITVTNPATTTGTANTAFSQTFTQSGGAGAVTFTTVSTLPAGLALATNGTLSGAPTQTGTFPITVKVTDSNGCTANGPVYNLVISCQTITVTRPATTTGTISAPFSQQFTQSGAIGATTFTTASTLPTGLSLATNGTLSGTPAQTGTFPITVKVTDANGCTGTSAVYNLVINCQTITVTNPATATGTASAPFSQTFTQSGAIGSATFATASTLPAGLSLATNGTLSGTPAQTGTFAITVTATDANGCTGTSAIYNLIINCQTITVTNPATATGTASSPFSQTFTQAGAIGAASFTTSSPLPAGLTLAANGTLSGTPTQTGSFPIVVKVTDSNGCTGTGPTYTLVLGCQTITVTIPPGGGATANSPFSATFTQSGAIGTATFTTTSTLPAGLTLGANGTLSGTPLQTGSFPIIVKVTDSNGCTGTSSTFDLGVGCQVITVVNPATTTGTAQAPFNQTFTAPNGIGARTFSTASTLPAGLTFAANGTLSGTPTQTGTFPIVVNVTDGNGCPGSGPTYNLVIGCQTISVTNPANAGGTVSSPFSVQFGQTGAFGTATFTTASSLPAGLTLSSTGVLSGTPTQIGSFPIVVTVTDSNGCTGSGATYNLVVGCQTITVNNPATTSSPAGTPLSIDFMQVGALGGATFTTSSTLPTGLSLAPNGTLSGTPTQGGGFPIVVTVTDGNGCTGTNPPYSLTITCPTITVTNPGVSTGTAGTPFSQTFTQSGGQGTITWSETGGLPSGITLNSSTGVLSGTATQVGSFSITVTATDQNGCTGTSPTYTLVMSCPTITVTNPVVNSGTAGSAFSQTFTQSGAAGSATFATSSTLPAGLSLSSAGVLSGTPTQAGSFSIVVTVTDSAGCTGAGSTYTLTINCQTITVTNPGTTNGTVLTPFSQTFTQSGGIGTATFTTASTLPSGLTLATNGTLSGTPMQPGTFPIVVTVTDSNGCTGTGPTYNLVIACQTIGIAPPTNTTGTVGTFYTETFVASNTIGTTTWSTPSTLPTGITLNSSTGVLSGTPTQSGSFLILIAVKDSNNCQASRSFTLVISCQTITVTNPGTTTGTVGSPFSALFTQSGALGGATFTTASTLPTGLSLAADGTLAGTPVQSGTFSIVVTVTDGNGCTGTSPTYTLVIACNVITVTNPATSTGTVDAPFSQTFTQSGGNGAVTFTINSGTLPAGLTLSSAGVLSGTPTQPGSFAITVKATDGNGCTGIGATYTLVIACQTITVNSPGVTTGTVDAPFSQSFTQTGVGTHTPATFTLNSGSLPAGLTLSSAGLLSGTPSQPGSFSITVKVTDANGCFGVSATYTLVIACQTITVNNPATSTGTFNTAFSQSFTQSGVGAHTPANFTINSGTLPTGLSLSSAGVLSGTPSQTGTFPITVLVTDANGCTGTSATYNLAINPNVGPDAYSNLVDNTQAFVSGGTTVAPGTPAVSLSGSVTANDLPAGGVTVTAGTFATTAGGSVTIAADGTFLYTPKANPGAAATTSDTFSYTATSNTGATATPTSASGTVTLTLAGRVWYVKNNGGGTNGQSQSPFTTLAAAASASTANDIIFVYNGDGSNSGQNAGISLKSGQQLLGEINGLTVNAQTLVAVGSRPVIGNSAGDGVTVPATAGSSTGVFIKGLSIAGTANGINLNSSGANTLTATVDNVIIISATANNGIRIAGASTTTTTVTVQNSTVSSATQNGIDAQQTSAGNLVLNINNNTITATGTGINVNGLGSTSATIINFANNNVTGNTAGNGITVTSATFDAVPGALFQTVSGGTTVIGVLGNGVGASGMVLTNVSGDLSFTDLDIVSSGGAALFASGTTPFTGSAGFQIAVGSGVATLDATGGPAADLNTVTANLPFSTIKSANSATTGVSLVTVPGTFTAGVGSTITNATGTDFNVNGSNATVTYDGTISDTSGRLVSIANTTGGTKTFSGAITDTNSGVGTGISLTTNTGATINFTGTLTLSTGSNAAFAATGGGTVSSSNTSSTIVTTTGTALNVANTTIGAANLNFRSINAGTAGSGPANAIILNNTGASGGLIVSGTGSAGTGGTIQKTTGQSILLTSTKNIDLSFMNIQNSSAGAINGTGVNGFSLTSCSITGNVGGINDGQTAAVILTDTTNAVAFISDTVTGTSGVNAFNVELHSSAASTAAITTLTVTGGSYSNSAQNGGFLIDTKNTAKVGAAFFSGVTFNNNFSKGLQMAQNDNAVVGDSVTAPLPSWGGTPAGSITVTGCTFVGNNVAAELDGGTGIAGAAGSTYYRFVNNGTVASPIVGIPVTTPGTGSSHCLVFANGSDSGGGTYKALISGNVLGSATQVSSGKGNGMRIFMQGQQTATVTVLNNTVMNCPIGRGIEVSELGRPGGGFGQTQLNIKLTGNTVNPMDSTGFPLYAIYVGADAQGTGTSGSSVAAEIHGNSVPTPANGACDTQCTFTPATAMLAYETVSGATGTHTGTLFQTGPGGSVSADIAATNTGTAGKTCAYINGGTLTLVGAQPPTVP